jgi:hypothetical protein
MVICQFLYFINYYDEIHNRRFYHSEIETRERFHKIKKPR